MPGEHHARRGPLFFHDVVGSADLAHVRSTSAAPRPAVQPEWIGPVSGSGKQGTLAGELSSCMTQALDSAIGNCLRQAISHMNANGVLRK